MSSSTAVPECDGRVRRDGVRPRDVLVVTDVDPGQPPDSHTDRVVLAGDFDVHLPEAFRAMPRELGLASTTPPPLAVSSLPTASPLEPITLLCTVGASNPVAMLAIEAGRAPCTFADFAGASAGGPYSGFASASGPRAELPARSSIW